MEENNNEEATKVKKKVDYILLKRDVRTLMRGQTAMSKDVRKIKGWMVRQKRSQTFGWWILKMVGAALANISALIFALALMVKAGVPLKEALLKVVSLVG